VSYAYYTAVLTSFEALVVEAFCSTVERTMFAVAAMFQETALK